MNYYILLLVLFSLLSVSEQSYSYCRNNYYSPTYYFYNTNGAFCCYRYSYTGSYYYNTYYVYCPYYTYATTIPATTSISHDCNTYYYSYYYSSSCCYKNVEAYNAYYSNNYFYTTSDCDLPKTTTPAPSSCYYYYYSSYYGTNCCTFRENSYSSTYDQYCPSTSTLSSQCGTSCCTAYAPVYDGYDTFYYSQYFCPDTSSNCGSFCVMAITFGILGLCFCICGLGFTITFFILVVVILNKNRNTKVQITQPNHYRSVSILDPRSTGLDYKAVEVQQIWRKESLPPNIPGYTYKAIPAITADTQSSPQSTGATNVPTTPVCVLPSHIDT